MDVSGIVQGAAGGHEQGLISRRKRYEADLSFQYDLRESLGG